MVHDRCKYRSGYPRCHISTTRPSPFCWIINCCEHLGCCRSYFINGIRNPVCMDKRWFLETFGAQKKIISNLHHCAFCWSYDCITGVDCDYQDKTKGTFLIAPDLSHHQLESTVFCSDCRMDPGLPESNMLIFLTIMEQAKAKVGTGSHIWPTRLSHVRSTTFGPVNKFLCAPADTA